jgi:hypothetical protein
MSCRTLIWLLCALLSVLAAPDPTFALEGTADVAAGAGSLVVEAQARKGTRLYMQDQSVDYGTLVEGQEKATATRDASSSQQKLDQCMASWDTGTHITKPNWRKICERQLSEGGL